MEKPEIKVLDDALDDWELIEDVQEMIESGDPLKSISVYKKLIGLDQYNALKAYLKERDGRVKTTEMINELNSIMEGNTVKK